MAQIDTIAGKSVANPIAGRVSQVDAAITPETQMFKVAVDLDASASANSTSVSILVQGMLVRGKIIRKLTDAGIVIPAASVVVWNEDNTAKVFLVNQQDTLELRNIKIDR